MNALQTLEPPRLEPRVPSIRRNAQNSSAATAAGCDMSPFEMLGSEIRPRVGFGTSVVRSLPDVPQRLASEAQPVTVRVDVMNAVPSRERTLIQVLASLVGGVGTLLIVPMAVLLLGLPVVLTARGLIEVIRWVLE